MVCEAECSVGCASASPAAPAAIPSPAALATPSDVPAPPVVAGSFPKCCGTAWEAECRVHGTPAASSSSSSGSGDRTGPHSHLPLPAAAAVLLAAGIRQLEPAAAPPPPPAMHFMRSRPGQGFVRVSRSLAERALAQGCVHATCRCADASQESCCCSSYCPCLASFAS